MSGLAAAEADNPRKAIPQATKQVFWRIAFFYVVTLFLVGLIVPYTDPNLLHASGAHTKYSPFVIALNIAGIKVAPSLFNVVILLSVLSVANSCTFGSTRTIQALAEQGMAPKIFRWVDKSGRPVACVVLQLVFGLLAFINEATASSDFFTWLLSLSGLGFFFVWFSICVSHIRFRAGWKAQGRSLDELPYKATFGIYGSWAGAGLNILCLIAQFYVALFVSLGHHFRFDTIANSLAARWWWCWHSEEFLRSISRLPGRPCPVAWMENIHQGRIPIHPGKGHGYPDRTAGRHRGHRR